jgi:hypothetical protein
LKSLDSDERIQGNPRKSNSHKMRVSQPNGDRPRKSKRIGRANGAPHRPQTITPAPVP